MEYISHEDYKKMMENFSKGTPKQSLNESIEEASAVVRKPAADLKAGDVLTSGATVIRDAQVGARTPSGKVDLVVRYPNGKESLVVWGKTTAIGVRNSAEPSEGLEKEDFERPDAREMEEENELGRITDAVERVFANDSLTTANEIDALAEEIRNAWSKSRGYGQGDEIDFVAEYLTDWANNVRHGQFSQWEKPSVGEEENTIWGEDWKNWINTAVRNISEGNAFTAGLAKAKKGEEFKVGDKTFKDRTNYDASVSEEYDSPYDGGADDLAAMASDNDREVAFAEKAIEKILGEPVKFVGQDKNDLATYVGSDPRVKYSIDDLGFIYKDNGFGRKKISNQPIGENIPAVDKKLGSVDEYQFDQMYPDDPGPFEGKDVDKMIKEFLLKEDDVNWDRMDDEEAEENETDNGIEEGKDMEEGLNPAPFQATGPTIQTVEAKHDVTKLKAEERDQLKQYIETIRTVKEEISKMLNKTKMKEGGDNTNLIMKPSTVSEDEMEQGGNKHEAIEKALGAKHQVIHNAIDKIIQTVKESGFSEGDAALFLQHEIEEKAKEYAMGQYD